MTDKQASDDPSSDDMPAKATHAPAGERIAKAMARAGVASRRDAERMILAGRVAVNGTVITSPALDVTPSDKVTLDGKPIDAPQAMRMWLYYKPLGLVTSEKDEKGRQTVFDSLPEGMPRVMSVGRLDLNSEGLLLLTNDGALKRRLELPETGWLRKYRVRVNGRPTDEMLKPLRSGVTVKAEDGTEETFLPMDITIDRQQGANAWLTIGLREGKNREIRRAMTEVGLVVNRLIRVSYGPFRLNLMKPGEVVEVKARVLRDQLGGLVGEEGAEARPARKPRATGSDRPARRSEGPDAPARKPRHKAGGRADGAGDRKPYAKAEGTGDRPARKSFGDRPQGTGDRPDRKPYGDRKPYAKAEGTGDRPDRKPYGDRKPYAKAEGTGDRPARKPYPKAEGTGDRPARKPYGDRPRGAGDRPDRKPYGDRKPYPKAEGTGDRPARKPYGDRPQGAGDRPDRTPYGDRKPYPKAETSGDRPARKPFAKPEGDGGHSGRSDRPKGARAGHAGSGHAGSGHAGSGRAGSGRAGSGGGGPRGGAPKGRKPG